MGVVEVVGVEKGEVVVVEKREVEKGEAEEGEVEEGVVEELEVEEVLQQLPSFQELSSDFSGYGGPSSTGG